MKLASRISAIILCLALIAPGYASQRIENVPGKQAKKNSAQLLDELKARAKVIKPATDEIKWQQIPWVLDLAEGQKLAQQEQRPIFLWVTGDDPLERC